jgi:hypothetical protein
MSTKKENNVPKYVSTYEPSTRTTNVRTSYQPIHENQIISILEGYNFEVKGKYIYKRSQSNRLEVCGNFNEASIYFHASNNIFPFESGTSYSFHKLAKGFNTSLVSNYELEQIAKKRNQEKLQEKPKKTINFDEYLATTNENHNFNLQLLLNSYHNNSINNLISVPKVWSNENNVRGRWNKTYFPLLNENEKFITAQIIDYKSNLKRNRDTNIYFLASNGNIGLYRRNLFDETLKTIIVESPKLAELGALILPKFNWFATIGKEKLNTLDLSFLSPGTTYILPDYDAFDEWKNIAVNKWNFDVLDIFQKEIENFAIDIQKEYSDFADLILHYLQCKNDSRINKSFYKIYSSLINLQLEDEDLLLDNSPQIDAYDIELGFGEKKRKNIRFVSSIPMDFCENTKGIYKQSAEGGYSIKTEYFEVFADDFELISASFDICKEQSEEQFILNLEKSFRVLRYLNEKSYLELFDIVLAHIQTKGNYLFNQSYIRNVLISQWEEIDALNVDELIKKRNFNYLGGANFNNYEFLAELRKAKKLYKINSELHAIREIVKSGIENIKFIEKKELGLKKEVGNEYIFNLINRFNIASIGSIDKRICEVVKTLVMFNITISKGYYYFYKEKISINEVCKITSINRVTLGNLLKFKRNEQVIENILIEIDFLIDNYNSFDFNRIEVKGKIYNSVLPLFKAAAELKHIELKDAFDCELDLNNSILHCDIDEAYNRGMDFYISWYLFNNNVMDEEDRSYIKDYRYDLFHRDWNPMQLTA